MNSKLNVLETESNVFDRRGLKLCKKKIRSKYFLLISKLLLRIYNGGS